MDNFTTKKVFELREKWRDYSQDSWKRGDDNLQFIERSEQYDSGDDNQEQFVFNLCNKILKTAQANGKDIDLTLNLYSMGYEEKEEKSAFKKLLSQLMLSGNNMSSIATSLDKVYSFGQSVFHVKPMRENNETLNQVLRIECLRDPKTAFFDPDAPSPTFHDGKYCGRSYQLSGKDLAKKYKRLRDELQPDKKYEIIDFWYITTKSVNYKRLITKEYKREDLLHPVRDIVDKKERDKIDKKSLKEYVVYLRVMKGFDRPLEKQLYEQIEVLPLVMDYGGYVWTGDNKLESYPLGWHLRDAQILLNYSGTLIADIMKSMKADRFFLSPEHLQSQEARQSAAEINTREGALLFTGELAKIRREMSQQLPEGLLSYFGELTQLIQNLAGSYVDGTNSEIKAMSGVALDKMFNRVDLVQNPIIVAHLNTLNTLGYVLQCMIPTFYYQHRKIGIKNDDGTVQNIEINKTITQPGGLKTIENDIRHLRYSYEYRIKGSVAKRLQKQNLQFELQNLYQLYPQAIGQTIDIYINSLDIPQADTISRRLGVNIPRDLIRYGNGDINYEQYMQLASQQQAQAQMQAQQAMQQSPQYQALQAKAQSDIARSHADMSKAQSAQYQAETDRMKAQAASLNEHIKNVSNAAKVKIDADTAHRQQELEMAKAHMQQANDIIESLSKIGNSSRAE